MGRTFTEKQSKQIYQLFTYIATGSFLFAFLSFDFFSKSSLFFSFKKFFQKISIPPHECQTVFDQDQARHLVWPDLGANCLQRLSADDKSRFLQRKR